jgi:uncharacterized protein YjdB
VAAVFRARRVVSALVATMVLVGCGDGPLAPGGDDDVTLLQLDQLSATATSLGEIVEFTARALDRNGIQISPVSLTWSSSDTTVLVSEGNGRFRARSDGGAVVTVRVTRNSRVPGRTAQVAVQQRAARLTLSADTLDLYAIGHMATLTATVSDALGNALASPPALVWRSGNPAVATVDATGTVTARGDGEVLVSLQVESLTAAVVTRVAATLRIAGCVSSADATGASCRNLLLMVGAGR